jgi:hypothetical protein
VVLLPLEFELAVRASWWSGGADGAALASTTLREGCLLLGRKFDVLRL